MLFAKFCLPTNSFASYFSSILVLRILFLISNLLNVNTYVVRQLQLSTMEKTKKDFGSRVDQVTKLEFFVFNCMCALSYLRVGEWVFGYFLRFLRPASMNWPPFLHQGLAWEDSSSLIPDMRWTHAVASFLLQDALNYWGHWTALRLCFWRVRILSEGLLSRVTDLRWFIFNILNQYILYYYTIG